MKNLILILLATTLAACTSNPEKTTPSTQPNNETRKPGSLDFCPEVVRTGTDSHIVRVSRPLDYEGYNFRHAQVQSTIATKVDDFLACRRHHGGLEEDAPIVFDVTSEGNFIVKPESNTSPTAKCFERVFKVLNAEVYNCELGFSYDWNGKFPLINEYQRTYPRGRDPQIKDY